MRARFELAVYAFVRGALVALCRLFWRERVEGLEHVPADGPFILSAVHRSNIDTPLVAAVTRRRLRYMGKKEMWKLKPAAWLFTTLGGFPVNRGAADREALRTCIEVLRGGEPLVVFPEGSRRTGPVVGEIFEGAAYLSAKTGAPIVPVGIGGSEAALPIGAKVPRPVRVHLVVGPPLQAEDTGAARASRRAVRELNDRLRSELQRLFDEAQKKAGQPASRGPG
ncbi:MAG: 1-acyl-sn-glycerol-3-phosphate acyltransferase [Actinobacteria bacterium]|nr:1-acyl-sn-glycerol-3-phosphate acyltransferase [Actinomycetota bacterium]